jgi:hypothetical protein
MTKNEKRENWLKVFFIEIKVRRSNLDSTLSFPIEFRVSPPFSSLEPLIYNVEARTYDPHAIQT